jgi:soluble lytic murein transglycosylase-like protein
MTAMRSRAKHDAIGKLLRIATRAVIAGTVLLHPTPVLADLWAYVDEHGRSHVADRQIDARYKLFYKGDVTLNAPDDAAAERERAVAALAGTRLYQRAIDDTVTRRFTALIERHARSNGLDPLLVKAVVAVESAFDPLALSPKGAVGLMQVIPDTAARYGLAGDARATIGQKLLDPTTNVRIGTRYLRDLLARFDNQLPLALAAYNAGEGSVTSYNDRIPPFAETRDYVKRVQQVYALYRPLPDVAHPARFKLKRARAPMDRANADPPVTR